MDQRRIMPMMTVSPQIELADLQTLADAGVTTLIDNRPDSEIGGELVSSSMADAAEALGMAFHYLPIMPGHFEQSTIDDFARIIGESQGTVHAYCRSGTRSATVWALANAGKMPVDEILKAAADAGYDLSYISSALT